MLNTTVSQLASQPADDATAGTEYRIRGIVAELLGVEPGELAPDVSLVDDLAADSLELAEIAVAIERELGVVLPQRQLEQVRTYGDLVSAIPPPPAGRPGPVGPVSEMPASLRVHIASFARPNRWTLDRIVWLTPYGIETIVADALRAGRGVEVELTVPPETTPAMLASLRMRLAPVTERGIPLHIRMARERPRVG